MRVLAPFFCLLLISLPAKAYPDDPGTMQDAQAEREKILKASDQINLLETNSEAMKASVDDMKAQMAKLRDENATLKQQLADLQAAFDKSEAAHAKEQKVLVDSVAEMIASSSKSSASKPPKKHTADTATETSTPKTEADPAPAPTHTATISPPADDAPATPKPQKGYYHIVASGETLTMICTAYREQGIKVTVSEIQKANNLTDKSVLKVGQKLFIPKPGN